MIWNSPFAIFKWRYIIPSPMLIMLFKETLSTKAVHTTLLSTEFMSVLLTIIGEKIVVIIRTQMPIVPSESRILENPYNSSRMTHAHQPFKRRNNVDLVWRAGSIRTPMQTSCTLDKSRSLILALHATTNHEYLYQDVWMRIHLFRF